MGKIQTFTIVFQDIHYAQTMDLMGKIPGIYFLESHLTPMTEWRVPKIMTQCNGFGQIFVQVHGTPYCSSNLCDLEGMR
jgi:hypothetical protein